LKKQNELMKIDFSIVIAGMTKRNGIQRKSRG
jgi:hypothetical protein